MFKQYLSLCLGLLCLVQPASADPSPAAATRAATNHEAAVAVVLDRLTPTQRSIVMGTPKDNLFMLQPEWGDDIEEVLQLSGTGAHLLSLICQRPCTPDEAALRLMESVWDTLLTPRTP